MKSGFAIRQFQGHHGRPEHVIDLDSDGREEGQMVKGTNVRKWSHSHNRPANEDLWGADPSMHDGFSDPLRVTIEEVVEKAG